MGKKLIDLTGRRFGRLLVLGRAEKKDRWGKVMWLVKCKCGEELTENPPPLPPVSGASLRRGLTRSCGCLRDESSRSSCLNSPRRLPLGRASRNALMGVYRNCAARRGWVWEIENELFDEITQQPCHYCGNPPSAVHQGNNCGGGYTYSGIDRKNSEKGYTKDNVLPCCFICNRAKMTMSYDEFINYLERVKTFRLAVSNQKIGLSVP